MKRKLKGTVVSTGSEKTVSVRVERSKIHPLYRKRFVSSKKFLAHDELGVEKDDVVVVEEVRPISKKKKWKVIQIVEGKGKK
ncbi:MAG: 30S ribosomal protein S17 [Patescibacteria group bacterium]|nr:30S ribosomal protein S17 [Patescibacteria group bacterium]